MLTDGYFRVQDVTLPFRLVYHRPLPAGGYLKAATLVGTQTAPPVYRRQGGTVVQRPARWQWRLCLTVELPPAPRIARPPRQAAAIDVGYRVLDQDRVQVALVLAEDGTVERLILPEPILRSFRYLRELQQRIDTETEQLKQVLRERPPAGLPEAAQRLLSVLTKVRDGGLRRLLALCLEAQLDGPAVERLTAWAARVSSLRREAAGLRQRMIRHRNWWYQNQAARLCRAFGTLVIEALDLRELAEQEPTTPVQQEAAKYRQLAGLSRFRAALQHAAPRAGTTLVQIPAAGTTARCAACGRAMLGPREEQVLRCEQGHVADQDVNACRNLLQQWQASAGAAASQTGPGPRRWTRLRGFLSLLRCKYLSTQVIWSAADLSPGGR
ncbi:zinc ribbon domain-containing protein [Nitrospira calida]